MTRLHRLCRTCLAAGLVAAASTGCARSDALTIPEAPARAAGVEIAPTDTAGSAVNSGVFIGSGNVIDPPVQEPSSEESGSPERRGVYIGSGN